MMSLLKGGLCTDRGGLCNKIYVTVICHLWNIIIMWSLHRGGLCTEVVFRGWSLIKGFTLEYLHQVLTIFIFYFYFPFPLFPIRPMQRIQLLWILWHMPRLRIESPLGLGFFLYSSHFQFHAYGSLYSQALAFSQPQVPSGIALIECVVSSNLMFSNLKC